MKVWILVFFLISTSFASEEWDELLGPSERQYSEDNLDYLSELEGTELSEFEELHEIKAKKKKKKEKEPLDEWEELTEADDLMVENDKDYLELQGTVKIEESRNKIRSAWDIRSTELLEDIEVNDFSFEEDLIPEGEKPISDLNILLKNSKDTISKLPYKERKKTKYDPEPFIAVIHPGAMIEEIDTGKLHKVDRKLMVKAINNVVGGSIIYLFDKEGKRKYRTLLENITDIDHMVNLKTNPSLFKKHLPRAQMEGNDREVKLIHNFSLSQEGIRGDYFRNLYGSEESGGSVNQLDYQVFYSWPFSFKMGLSAGFQRGTWQGSEDSLQWTTGLYGLSLNQNFHKNWEVQLNASRYFLMSGSDSQGGSIRFQGNQFGVDLINIYQTEWGPFFIALTLNQSYYSVKESNRVLSNAQEPESITTFGAKIGFRFEKDFWRYTF